MHFQTVLRERISKKIVLGRIFLRKEKRMLMVFFGREHARQRAAYLLSFIFLQLHFYTRYF